jgi:peptidoglycan/LPS O-acetylase OafA/YrhL
MTPTPSLQPLEAEPGQSAGSSARLPALDGLRGIAIVAVLLHHLTVFSSSNGLPARLATLAEFCSHGVDLFFVLSGFLILDRLHRDSGQPGWIRRFWSKRLAKIGPAYFVVIAGVFLLLPTLLALAGATTKLSLQRNVHGNWLWYATLTSNLLNARDGRFTNPALDVCWSLAIEVQFYVFIACWVRYRGMPTAKALASMVVIAVVSRIIAVMLDASWISILVLPWCRLDAFALGGAVALGYDKWLAHPIGRGVALLTLAAPWFLEWTRESAWVQILGYTAVAISAAVMMKTALTARPSSLPARILGARILTLLGAISYSVYLTHLPVRAALRDLALPRFIAPLTGPGVIVQQLAFIVFGGGACIAIGWVLWRFFEEPVRRLLVRSLTTRPSSKTAIL